MTASLWPVYKQFRNLNASPDTKTPGQAGLLSNGTDAQPADDRARPGAHIGPYYGTGLAAGFMTLIAPAAPR